MADADRFAEAFAFWVEAASPKRYDLLLDRLLPTRVGEVLDIGCGPGYLSLHLAARAEHVVGFDLSPAMIRIARRYRDEARYRNIDFLVGDAHCMPFTSKSFDLVVSDTTLHDTEISVTLPIIRELVRPGGLIVLRDKITHNRKRAASPLWQLLGAVRSFPRYVRRSGPATALRLLRFETSPEWVLHRAEGRELTPSAFRQTYGRELPGCEVVEEDWFMTALWKAPGARA